MTARQDRPLLDATRRVGVTDRRVLDAVASIPREPFVPPDQLEHAAEDRPLPIGGGQTTSQPSLIAAMVAALELQGHERVLEIGTGFGYQTAILAHLAAEVYSIDRSAVLVARARENLAAAGIDGCHLVVGDGTLGLPEHAPYHAMVVAAAAATVPPALAEQLHPGGRLVVPVGPSGSTEVMVYEGTDHGLRRVRRLVGARFVPLVPGVDDPDP